MGGWDEYRYEFRDGIEDEYMLKLFGVASRQINDELRLFRDWFGWPAPEP